jgi:hypothetical protein
VLLDFGFGESAPSIEELAQPGKIWMLGRKPWRIDLLTEIDGIRPANSVMTGEGSRLQTLAHGSDGDTSASGTRGMDETSRALA